MQNLVILARVLLVAVALSLSVYKLTAYAHEAHAQPSQSLAISVVFDAQGKLWRATKKDGHIWVDSSQDLGKTFSKAVQVNPQPQKIDADGGARPNIAIGAQGYIYLTWTEALKKPLSGYIWFARSTNQGKSFEKPYIVHQDRSEISHRFDALNISKNGTITVAWMDNRNSIASKATDKVDDGAAIYYAKSLDNGASFATEQKLADGSCECCRIAFTNKPDGTAVAMWRHVFADNERDHMIAEIPLSAGQAPVIKRATFGRWKINGCPHHGAALASGGEAKDWWGYHMAWFDGGNDDSGKNASLFYARMDGEAWVSSPAKKFGNHKNQAGHPALISIGEKVWLVWRETEDNTNSVMAMFSDDGGRSWGDTRVLARTADQSDYPQLIAHEHQVYLVWNTLKEGLQVIAW